MLQCVEGFVTSLLRCFDIDLYKNSRGLEDPELLARETVCTYQPNPYDNFVNFFFDSANGFRLLLILSIISKQKTLRFYAICLSKWFSTVYFFFSFDLLFWIMKVLPEKLSDDECCKYLLLLVSFLL